MAGLDLMLILKCCGHSEEDAEINSIISQAQFYGYQPIIKSPCDIESLEEDLREGIRYKYLFLSAHGDENGFQNESDSLNVSWSDFGRIICETECLSEEAILLLSCCRGGLNEIAYEMFDSCPYIEYICGPRQNIESSESIIGFSILLFNMIYRGLDPVLACDYIEKGVNIRFKCFDRMETMSDPGYLLRMPVEVVQERNEPTHVININADSFLLKSNTPKEVLEIFRESINRLIDEKTQVM